MRGKTIPITMIGDVEGRMCHYCNMWHSLAEFYVNKRGIRECKKMRSNQRTSYLNRRGLENAEQLREDLRDTTRRWRTKIKSEDIKLYKMQVMLQSAKMRAKRKEIPFNISYEDFPNWRQLDYCPIFPWIKLCWSNQTQENNSPSVDRIDCSKGYIPGNVRIISWRANCLRRDGTKQEFLSLMEDYKTLDK